MRRWVEPMQAAREEKGKKSRTAPHTHTRARTNRHRRARRRPLTIDLELEALGRDCEDAVRCNVVLRVHQRDLEDAPLGLAVATGRV